jgi:Fic family protein
MTEITGLRLEASQALKERRLTALLGERPENDPELLAVVRDAQVLGSLELAGLSLSWEAVRSGAPPAEVLALRRAQARVAPQAPLDREALLEWHAEVTGTNIGFRRSERTREGGPPPAPAEFVTSRLRLLEEWLAMESGRELRPSQAAALALARIVEVLPFDDANGRVSRLAASHLMVRGGLRPPILVKGDQPRLEAALQAAFQLETEPLARLLEEASGRALDVMIQTLETPEGV